MAYFAPYIDSTGFHMPNYSDIISDLTEAFKSIYGQDIYLGNDAADYQMISVFANTIYDSMLVLQQAYNNRSPLTAEGVSLDGLVKNNGLTRKTATHSSCIVNITGIEDTIIINGIVQDLSGFDWELPSTVTIGDGGVVVASVSCKELGAVPALPGSIIKIVTPQYGWTGVENDVAAVLGLPIETDAQLRARQNISTRLAAHTMVAGTTAGIAAVSDVTRYYVHENNTDFTDAEGTPPHSITAVVEGGTDEDVATAIFYNRGIGCYTNGTTEVEVEDPDTGYEMTIRFMRPEYVPIYIEAQITKLTGYTDSITTQIEDALSNYLNALQIGQDLTISALYGAALAVMPSLITPLFSITSMKAGVTPGGLSTTDIVINFNGVTQGILGSSPAYITVIAI